MVFAKLWAVYEGRGLHDVQTHVQSGNAPFRSAEQDPAALARRNQASVATALGILRVTRQGRIARIQEHTRWYAQRRPCLAAPLARAPDAHRVG